MNHALLSRAVQTARRARRAAARVRRRIERVDTVPVLAGRTRPRAVLRPTHLSVLGGRTLNLAVRYPRRSPGISDALLRLDHRGTHLATPLAPEPQPDGTLLLTATVPLDLAAPGPPGGAAPEPGTLTLSPGLWRLSLEVTDAAGGVTRVDLAAPAVRAPDGPTVPHRPHPVSGALLRPVRSADGHALLKVAPPAAQAELTAVDLHWDRAGVRGRLLGPLPRHATWTAEVVRQGAGGVVLAVPLTQDADRFALDLPLAAMAADGRVQHTWEVRLRSGRSRLKLARRLTDVRRPGRVFRMPYRSVALDDGRLLRVHAQFSAAGTLSVSCAAYAGPSPGDTAPDRQLPGEAARTPLAPARPDAPEDRT